MKTLLFVFSALFLTGFLHAQNRVIKAGHLFDPRSGKMLSDQIIIIKNGKIEDIGSSLKYDSKDTVIDLSESWVLPGLMDCHVHITMNFNYKNWSYVQLYTTESSCLRALRGAYVAEQFLI